MKIGVSSGEYDRWGEEKYTKIYEHGFTAVDYNLAETTAIPYTLSFEEASAYLLSEKEKIEKTGLIISQVHGPWRWPPQDSSEEDRAERMEKMKKSIQFSAILGCKNWVVHPIMPFGVEEKDNLELVKQTWDMNIAFMRELLKTAKEFNVVICLENMPMPQFSLGSPQDTLRFVKEINDDNFQICFDTGHATMFSDKSVGDHVRELGDYIKAFHIHDNNGLYDLHMLPYFGVIDWADFGKALKDIDFNGVFSFESSAYDNLSNEEHESLCLIKYKMAKRILAE